MAGAHPRRTAAYALTIRSVEVRAKQSDLGFSPTPVHPIGHRDVVTVTQSMNHRRHLGRHQLARSRRRNRRQHRVALFGIAAPVHNELNQRPIRVTPSGIDELGREPPHRHRSAAGLGGGPAHSASVDAPASRSPNAPERTRLAGAVITPHSALVAVAGWVSVRPCVPQRSCAFTLSQHPTISPNAAANQPLTEQQRHALSSQQRPPVRSSAFQCVPHPADGPTNRESANILTDVNSPRDPVGTLVQTCGGQTTPNRPRARTSTDNAAGTTAKTSTLAPIQGHDPGH